MKAMNNPREIKSLTIFNKQLDWTELDGDMCESQGSYQTVVLRFKYHISAYDSWSIFQKQDISRINITFEHLIFLLNI